jgi:hypothetical protein
MRRALGFAALAGAAAGALVLLRRRAETRGARADLYFDDGSMLSLDDHAPEIDALLRAARTAAGSRA